MKFSQRHLKIKIRATYHIRTETHLHDSDKKLRND